MTSSGSLFNCDDVKAIKTVFVILGIILIFIIWAMLSIYGLPHVRGESSSTIFSNDPNLTISGQNISIVVNAGGNNTKDSNNASATEVIHHTAPTPFDGNGSMLLPPSKQQPAINNNQTNNTIPAANPLKKLGEQIKALFQPSKVVTTTANNTSNNNTTTTAAATKKDFPLSPVSVISHIERVAQIQQYDKAKNCALDQHTPTNPQTYLTHFSCGHLTVYQNGTVLREFTLIIEENHVLPITLPPKPILYHAWTFNGTIPGPTLRMTEGDHVRIKLVNEGTMSHTLHMHSIHPGAMDGVPGLSGASGNVPAGHSFTYDFIAQPYGVYPYHCHASPIELHINKGLYGVLIIDPKTPRPAAHEFVMLLNGYHLNNTDPEPRMPTQAEANALMGTVKLKQQLPTKQPVVKPIIPLLPSPRSTETSKNINIPQELDNDIYTVNGVAFYYMQYPIQLKANQEQRIYLVNMLDFEENSYHMHGNLFQYYPSGTSLTHLFTTDMVTLGQGDRAILEFNYHYPGLYMQHAHFAQISERGWAAVFEVK